MKKYLLFLIGSLLMLVANGQVQNDSLQLLTPDTLLSVDSNVKKDVGFTIDFESPFFSQELSWQLLKRNPYYGFSVMLQSNQSDIHKSNGKELLFYFLVLLLILFALIRRAFPKYFNDLFRLFFRTTLKQRQIREQLIQTPLPSLSLNVFFVLSAGLYVTFLFQHFNLNPLKNFWWLFLYSSIALALIYFIKFLGLKFSGWLFNMQETADAYIFIVFIINKMVGIFLLPFLVLLAFTADNIYTVTIFLSYCLIGGLFAYRFILTFITIRNQVKVNPFHFFLYFCAFEIVPLLLIYKSLLLFFGITS